MSKTVKYMLLAAALFGGLHLYGHDLWVALKPHLPGILFEQRQDVTPHPADALVNEDSPAAVGGVERANKPRPVTLQVRDRVQGYVNEGVRRDTQD